MRFFLLVFISLFVIRYSLFVSFSFAQTITPTITSAAQVNPQAGNPVVDFINSLIPQTLNKVNCANLPLEACQGIKSTTNTSLNAQGNTPENTIGGNAAGQYTIATGVHTPLEVANASTNLFDLIASLISFFGDILTGGNKQAKNYAGTVLPQDVTNQNFAQGVQNISGFASGDTNVLGAQTGQTVMDKALPLVQCAALPAGLCTDNKPNFTKSNL